MFKSPQGYIDRNAAVDPDSGEKVSEVREVTVAGRKAFEFERETPDRMPSGEGEEFMSYERTIVVTAPEGFYVLSYRAPESAEGDVLTVFDKIAASFKPNK